jgi:DNA-binding MarR family transcriptional regulator
MEDALGILLSRALARMKHELCMVLRPYDVTPEQLALLECLWEKDEIFQKELSEKTFKDQSTTTRILDRLESKGLVKRLVHPDDRRAFSIALTDEGRDFQTLVMPMITKARNRGLKGLNPEEIEQLKVLLVKICDNLD